MSFAIFGDGGEKESCGECNHPHRTAYHECERKQHPHALLGDWMEAPR